MNENQKIDIGTIVGGTNPANAGPMGMNHGKVAFPGSAPVQGLSSQLGLHNRAYAHGHENLASEHSSVQQMPICLTTGNDGNKSPGIILGYAAAFNMPQALGGISINQQQTQAGVSSPGYNEPHTGSNGQPQPNASNRPVPHQRDIARVKWPNTMQPVTSGDKDGQPHYGNPYSETGQKWQETGPVNTAKSRSSQVGNFSGIN